MIKKVVLAAILFSSVVLPAQSYAAVVPSSSIELIINDLDNNESLEVDNDWLRPYVDNGTILVDYTKIQLFDGSFKWLGKGQFQVSGPNKTATLTVGSNIATINGVKQKLTFKPQKVGYSTYYVPIKFLCEIAGVALKYDGKTKMLTVNHHPGFVDTYIYAGHKIYNADKTEFAYIQYFSSGSTATTSYPSGTPIYLNTGMGMIDHFTSGVKDTYTAYRFDGYVDNKIGTGSSVVYGNADAKGVKYDRYSIIETTQELTAVYGNFARYSSLEFEVGLPSTIKGTVSGSLQILLDGQLEKTISISDGMTTQKVSIELKDSTTISLKVIKGANTVNDVLAVGLYNGKFIIK